MTRPNSASSLAWRDVAGRVHPPAGPEAQPALATELGVSLNRLNEIVLGKRGITADTAIRLARRFEMSPQFWMRLQADWELAEALARGANDAA